MGIIRDENSITESIFLPIYNRSSSFRKWISGMFGKDFGSSIRFTGDENKNNSDNEYGCPDAISDKGNFIEIKTRMTTKLTDNEKQGGMDGNGYKKYLNKNSDKLLLYVVPRKYDLSEAVEKGKGERVRTITWDEIVDFLREQNNSDPMIGLIYNKVENVEPKKVKTLESYKVKAYEVIAKLQLLNKNISVNIDNDCPIENIPENMENDDWQEIEFSYLDRKETIGFEKKDIILYLQSIDKTGDEKTNRYKDLIMQKYGFELFDKKTWWKHNGMLYYKTIISQDDFWEKSEDELSLVFNAAILNYQLTINEIEKTRIEYKWRFQKKFPDKELIEDKIHDFEEYVFDSKNSNYLIYWDGFEQIGFASKKEKFTTTEKNKLAEYIKKIPNKKNNKPNDTAGWLYCDIKYGENLIEDVFNSLKILFEA